MKEIRILDNLGQVDEKYIFEAIPGKEDRKSFIWRKWGAAVACIVLVASLSIILIWQIFGVQTYTSTLSNGSEIVFVKNETISANGDIAIVGIRDLSEAEEKAVFGSMEADAYVGFKEETNEFIYLEGTVDGFKVIISRYDTAPCTVIEGKERVSDVNGTDVIAGLWLTDANSSGDRTAIAYASFEVGDYTVYLENSGNGDESEEICDSLAIEVQKMIKEGKWDFSVILL